MEKWQQVKLGKLFQIKHGYAFKGENFTDIGKYIVLTPGNFYEQGGFKHKGDKEKYYSADFPQEYILKKNDLLIVMTEQKEGLLGSPAFIPKDDMYLHNQRLGLIIKIDEVLVDKNFIYFLFNSYSVRTQINATANGAKVRHTSPSRIYNVSVNIPSLSSQKKISWILSRYDLLIERNNQRIKILQQLTKLIFNEWFVKFKFPGHEHVKMVDSELGEIPEGWDIKQIGDSFAVVLGGTPSRSKEEYWDGNIPWINSGKVNELRIIDESEGITELGLKKSATKMMPKRTTVLAITGATLGQVSITEIEVCANQSVVGIYDEQKNYSEYIYLKVKELIQDIIMKAGGGAQQHINKEIVSQTKVKLPSKDVLITFNKIIQPIFDEIANLLFKNKNLAITRDLLLPKLISGKIDVSELDIRIPTEVT